MDYMGYLSIWDMFYGLPVLHIRLLFLNGTYILVLHGRAVNLNKIPIEVKGAGGTQGGG
jgi:hypothetical protein